MFAKWAELLFEFVPCWRWVLTSLVDSGSEVVYGLLVLLNLKRCHKGLVIILGQNDRSGIPTPQRGQDELIGSRFKGSLHKAAHAFYGIRDDRLGASRIGRRGHPEFTLLDRYAPNQMAAATITQAD